VLAVLAAWRPVAADPLAELEAAQQALYDRVAPAVVHLTSDGGIGSGFFVAPGLILTNRHVADGTHRVDVVLRDGRNLVGSVIERAGGDIDLALIRVAADDIAPLALAPASPRIGAWIASVGHGVDSPWTFTSGMISNVYRNRGGLAVLQTQIPLNPGSSGSPIVDRLGNVVGIVTKGVAEANSVNFAIGAEVAVRALRGLASGRAQTVIYAPPGTPVFVDGQLAGTGSAFTLELGPGSHKVSAIVSGSLHERAVTCPCHAPIDLR
jgi:S1-C subfamily serine protease